MKMGLCSNNSSNRICNDAKVLSIYAEIHDIILRR